MLTKKRKWRPLFATWKIRLTVYWKSMMIFARSLRKSQSVKSVHVQVELIVCTKLSTKCRSNLELSPSAGVPRAKSINFGVKRKSCVGCLRCPVNVLPMVKLVSWRVRSWMKRIWFKKGTSDSFVPRNVLIQTRGFVSLPTHAGGYVLK